MLKPMYLSLTAFHFHIFTHKFLRWTLFKLSIPFLCVTPSSTLGHHVTPILMLSPLAATQYLQHSPWADSGFQNTMKQLEYERVNNMLTSATTWKQKQINTPPITHWNQFRLFHDSNRQQYGYVHHSLFYRTYCIFCRIYIIQQL